MKISVESKKIVITLAARMMCLKSRFRETAGRPFFLRKTFEREQRFRGKYNVRQQEICTTFAAGIGMPRVFS